MSMFSGKCDLFDHICGMAGWYDKDGRPVKFGDPGVGTYYGDEYRDFLEFKRKTGGIMYQHHEVKVTEWNQDDVAEKIPEQFKVIKHETTVEDRRHKSGKRTNIFYTYEYWGREYKTLKELNKHGVFVTTEIHFDTILDLIQYYPYIVVGACCDKDHQTIYLSKESFVFEERDEHYKNGYFSNYWEYYTKRLQEHYFEICRDYLCYKLEERTKIVPIDFDKMECPNSKEDGDYSLWVEDEIDCNHQVEFIWDDGELHPHWTSPKQVGSREIQISWEDINQYLKEDIKNGTVKIRYVALPEDGFPLHLG